MTLRKRIAAIAVSTLAAGVLSVTPSAHATHPLVGSNNANANTVGTIGGSLFAATASNGTSLPAVATTSIGTAALSKGLLAKDTTSGTAATAVVLPGGTLSLYGNVATAVTFSATAGTFSSVAVVSTGVPGVTTVPTPLTVTYNSSNSKAWVPIARFNVDSAQTNSATGVAALWTAPTTVGTYTVSMLTGFATQSGGTIVAPSSSTGDSPTLAAQILVTVVAATAGGSFSAANSACRTATSSLAGYNALSTTTPASDSTTTSQADGASWFIDFDLNDAYAADLDAGNIVVNATNGALVNIGTAGAIPVAGTSSTDVDFSSPSGTSFTGGGRNVRIDQPTAGAPLTTTVTISFNGAVACTKTVTITGRVAKLTVGNVGTQVLNGSSGSAQWMYQEIGLSTAGLFTVLATDSAGTIVDTNGVGTFAADATTLTTVVTAASVATLATSRSSSSPLRFSLGTFSCGATAGSSNIKIRYTNSASGVTVLSDAFAARCAGVASTYTVSLDKSAYRQGDIATATVQFLDSKGNKADSVTVVGANSWIMPYWTGVTFTTTGSSATAVTKADGTLALTFTIGTTTAVVNGSYSGVVSYDVPALGTKQTPTYTLSTGGDSTTNADVLKSIVALIASINKQIQALQKLILARR